ncbi:hypothetical protein GQ55_2G156700 [Panicum hallii var. hallii]|uniref:Secreted protein n=2 Tax=Panicum hallii TaxID=206008 RepID=A0A2T7EPW6_9POAL|nr:hypothetical protein GQ55_2G156700 [Panicum hallii var. hallii]PVH64013.1 hypothetical protein PAHAL_2G163800 [Panicum hallii]
MVMWWCWLPAATIAPSTPRGGRCSGIGARRLVAMVWAFIATHLQGSCRTISVGGWPLHRLDLTFGHGSSGTTTSHDNFFINS